MIGRAARGGVLWWRLEQCLPGRARGRLPVIPGLCALAVSAAAMLAIAPSPASAAKTRVLEASFGPDGTATTAFERPAAVGVDQSTGQIYVEDAQANTVQRFDAEHKPEPFTGVAKNIELGGLGRLTGFSFQSGLDQLAVDSTSHDFYVVDFGGSSVRAYQSDGEPANFTAGAATGTNELGGSEPCGVAVDSNGAIYVSFVDGVHVYASSGEPLIPTPVKTSGFPCNLAVSSPGIVDEHGAVYADQFGGGVEKLIPSGPPPVTASTTYTSAGIVDTNVSHGVAVDPITDHVFVDEYTQVAEYNEGATEELLSFGGSGPGALSASEGLAVYNNAGTSHVYVSDAAGEHRVQIFGPAVALPAVTTGKASEIGPKGTATLNGTVNPEEVEVKDCHFDYVDEAQYEPKAANPYAAGATAPCEQTVGNGTNEVAVTAKIKGLTPGTAYHFRLQATSEGTRLGTDATFSTLPPPAITALSATSITEASATLNAKVNPGGVEVTACQFEYGTEAGVYPTKLACTPPPGSGSLAVPVSAQATSLFKNTPYHWRVVASSEAGTTTTPDQTFIDLIGSAGEGSCAALAEPERQREERVRTERGSTGLPDCRAYEMVTPAQKNQALIDEFKFGGFFPQIAADGQRVIAGSVQCFAGPESCTAVRIPSEGQPFEFSRTAAGWVTHPLAPPISFETASLWTINADAGTTLFSVPRVPPGLFEEDFYGRDEHGSFVNVGPVGEHTPRTRISGVRSTSDLSHVLYKTNIGSVWSFDTSSGPTAVYEYTGVSHAAPLMVGVSGGFEKGENHKLIGTCGTDLGGASELSEESGALSQDGRTVYFEAEGREKGSTPCTDSTAPPARELYARIDGELPAARSVLISGPTPAACSEEPCLKNTTEEARARDANFEGASADGSRAFFTDTQQLTNGASEDPNAKSSAAVDCSLIAEAGGCNLYESVCPAPCGKLGEEPNASNRELADVSEGPGGAPVTGGPRVQGVVGNSADGSHVYFVAKGVLTGAEQNQSHETAEDGKENLYVYERDEAHPQGRRAFVARLAPSDRSEWQNLERGRANVTPTGRFLVLTSHRALTADATCVEPEGPAPVCPAQVFEYDAQARGMVRVSIGERGFNDNGNDGMLGEHDPSIPALYFGDARTAEAKRGAGSVPLRLDPTMSDDGAFVFFQSPVALTPGALNDVPTGEQFAQNVYEYHEGHVSLISDGKDTAPESKVARTPVELLGSDTTGANVFFTTFDPLAPEDTDTQRDIYDAHTCTEEKPCPPPPPAPAPCDGEACHGAPPGLGTGQSPGSESFTGPGNITPPPPPKAKTAAQIRAEKLAKALKACRRKHNKHKRAVCEKHAKKLYGKTSKAKKAKRATNNRRASS